MKVEFDVAPCQKPTPTEEICLISYEVTKILLAGDPSDRPAFWKTYRQQLAHNLSTNYNNYRLNMCRRLLAPLEGKMGVPWYFRDARLTTERDAVPPAKTVLPKGDAHP